MIVNMLHKCWWLFLVWKFSYRLLKIEAEKGEFVDFMINDHSLYVLLYVGLSNIIPTRMGKLNRW